MVLLVTTEFFPCVGGIGTYSEEVARAIHRRGRRVAVIAPDYGNPAVRKLDGRFPFPVIRIAKKQNGSSGFPGFVTQLASLAPKHSRRVVHSADLPSAMAVNLIPWLRKSQILSLHGSEVLRAGRSKLRKQWLRSVIASCSTVACNSNYTKSQLESSLGPCSNAIAAHLGVARHWFEPPDAADTAFVENLLGAGKYSRIVLTASRLDPRKGHLAVIEALGRLPDTIRAVALYVCTGEGEEGYRREIEALAAERKVKLLLVGNLTVNQLKALYARAYLFCMPGEKSATSVEGFGLAYLEAAAQGLPALAGSAGGVSEVIKHGETGLLVQAGDVEEIRAGLYSLLGSGERQRQLSRACKAHAAAFTWETHVQKIYGSPNVP